MLVAASRCEPAADANQQTNTLVFSPQRTERHQPERSPAHRDNTAEPENITSPLPTRKRKWPSHAQSSQRTNESANGKHASVQNLCTTTIHCPICAARVHAGVGEPLDAAVDVHIVSNCKLRLQASTVFCAESMHEQEQQSLQLARALQQEQQSLQLARTLQAQEQDLVSGHTAEIASQYPESWKCRQSAAAEHMRYWKLTIFVDM